MLAAVGLVWAILGAALILDVFGTNWFPIHVFGYLLVLEALVTLVATTSTWERGRCRARAWSSFFIIGLLIIDTHHVSDVILAIFSACCSWSTAACASVLPG